MTAEAWWRELVYSTYTLSGVEPKELDKNYDQLFTSVYNRFNAGDAYTIFPDVLPTLEELKNQGFRMGVISNADERLATIIDNLELGKYFDFVLASADVGVVKPNKAIYDKALKAAGREVKPQEALHVGDDVET
ncbi:HAD-like domain-containing protein [Mycotypha africana]|uniref:HAD-like domain-containing protein n=1 Tax=Mycotypha africana TaxID=64632 RepID=UPI0023016CC3|nr:HAD-like domain-containing protein [Mycotypha africana]KAI8975429.1 HAD-like domain-containing protein [Mycotypha africana]